jgi:hypothetical protein
MVIIGAFTLGCGDAAVLSVSVVIKQCPGVIALLISSGE